MPTDQPGFWRNPAGGWGWLLIATLTTIAGLFATYGQAPARLYFIGSLPPPPTNIQTIITGHAVAKLAMASGTPVAISNDPDSIPLLLAARPALPSGPNPSDTRPSGSWWVLGVLAVVVAAAVASTVRRVRSNATCGPLHVMSAAEQNVAGNSCSLFASSGSKDQVPSRQFTLPAPAIFAPYIGTGYRRTVCTELIPNTIWSFEQNQELSALTVNIRCTAIRLTDGSLWVHAPVFPTPEFLTQLDALGFVSHIVLPTFALEHKLPVLMFTQKYRAAEVWVVADTWSWPINLPLWMLGIRVAGLIGRDSAQWASEIESHVLKIDDVGSPFVEATFFHKATRSLLVTDLLYSIPREPPTVVDPRKLLEVAPDDPTQPLPDTHEARLQGWAKMALLVSFFIPARQRLVKGGKAEWQPGYMASFDKIVGRLIVSPILQALVLSKSTPLILPWLEKVCQWDFERVIPAHYAAPVPATPADVRAAFGFVTGDDSAMQLPEEDMRTLNELKAIVKKASTGEGEVYSELFDKFFKNLFMEKSGWMRDR